jgi:hypothetical protein
VDGFFNRRLVFQWIRIVLRYSPICFYTLIRQISFKGFLKKKIESYSIPLICHWAIVDLVIICIAPIQMSYKYRIVLTFKGMLRTLIFTLKSTTKENWKNLHDKRDDFTFPIVNFSFISSNIPTSPAHGHYTSHFIRYSRACFQCSGFLVRAQLLSQKLFKQGYVAPTLRSSLKTLYNEVQYVFTPSCL